MRLQRLYASKIYVTSTRKDKIRAAMDSPVNAPLILQLDEYLDREGQIELKRAKAEVEAPEVDEVIRPSVSSDAGGTDKSFAPPSGGASHSAFSGSPIDDFGDDELADIDIPDEDLSVEEPAEAEAPAPDDVVESVTQEGKPITATSVIWTTSEDVSKECDIIKGTLNAREDTKGVTRLDVKDSELWIYYNDESNLNDKMIEVISVINSTGYTYLKFNRLARSNNAIVFDITLNNSEMIKSAGELEQEK